MIRRLLVLLTVGLVGVALTGIVFSFVVPLVVLVVKIAFFVLVVYLILRLVNPKCAQDLKERVTGRGESGPAA